MMLKEPHPDERQHHHPHTTTNPLTPTSASTFRCSISAISAASFSSSSRPAEAPGLTVLAATCTPSDAKEVEREGVGWLWVSECGCVGRRV